jgi:hypothetical protein
LPGQVAENRLDQLATPSAHIHRNEGSGRSSGLVSTIADDGVPGSWLGRFGRGVCEGGGGFALCSSFRRGRGRGRPEPAVARRRGAPMVLRNIL